MFHHHRAVFAGGWRGRPPRPDHHHGQPQPGPDRQRGAGRPVKPGRIRPTPARSSADPNETHQRRRDGGGPRSSALAMGVRAGGRPSGLPGEEENMRPQATILEEPRARYSRLRLLLPHWPGLSGPGSAVRPPPGAFVCLLTNQQALFMLLAYTFVGGGPIRQNWPIRRLGNKERLIVGCRPLRGGTRVAKRSGPAWRRYCRRLTPARDKRNPPVIAAGFPRTPGGGGVFRGDHRAGTSPRRGRRLNRADLLPAHFRGQRYALMDSLNTGSKFQGVLGGALSRRGPPSPWTTSRCSRVWCPASSSPGCRIFQLPTGAIHAQFEAAGGAETGGSRRSCMPSSPPWLKQLPPRHHPAAPDPRAHRPPR